MQKDPKEWHDYHVEAAKYDQRDKVSPLDKITESLKVLKAGRKAIDLGCGMNTLAKRNSHLSWTSVDVVAADSSVIVADMTNLPFEDETFHVAILCRALWAQDREKVLSEANRILVEGRQLIIVEAFYGWYDDKTKTNELLDLVHASNLEVVKENGTAPNSSDDVFQYIICKKPQVTLNI